jgi:hypothetical protein
MNADLKPQMKRGKFKVSYEVVSCEGAQLLTKGGYPSRSKALFSICVRLCLSAAETSAPICGCKYLRPSAALSGDSP